MTLNLNLPNRKEKKIRFLIDFELSEKAIRKYGKLIPYDGLDEFFGSLMYALVNAHYGVFQTRSDGIFGLAYVLLKLLKGRR